MAERRVFTVLLNNDAATEWKFVNARKTVITEHGGGILTVEAESGNTFTFPVRSIVYTSAVTEEIPDE